MIKAQNGEEKVLDDYSLFGTTESKFFVKAAQNGYISDIDALKIAKACKMLGAGRTKKDEKIDLNVGIYLNKHYGDEVKAGEIIATLYYNESKKFR
ncbi:MAG: hypothetical protein L6V95_00125 [Candidatus Melainabacteria bacterium]|nr:MAG: hypothetical protein L6V95_00125 [Candidatus Melainabacteria bacterium]